MRTGRARAFVIVALGTLASLACGGPRPSVDVALRDAAPGAVLIRGVDVLDVEAGSLLRGRDVLLRDGAIASITPTGQGDAALGATTIDGAGATLVPGLVDLHGHVYADSAPSWSRGLPDPEANLREYLYAGVTTLLDPGDSSPEAFERRAAVAEGALIGPRVYTAGPILTAPGGHPIALVEALAPWWIGWYLAPRVAVPVADAAAAREQVDRVADEGADFVKVVMDRIPLDAPRMPTDVAAAIVTRAGERGLRTVAHIGTTEDAMDAGEAGVAAWVHGVYKERIPDEAIPKLASYEIPMVVTVEVFDRYARAMDGPREPSPLEREMVPAAMLDSFYPPPDDFDLGPLESWLDVARASREAMIDNVRRLHAAGVVILVGSDTQSGVFPGAGLHRELAHLVRAGLTPAQAIRAATLDSARFLAGPEAGFGSVAVGQRADLLLVEGDPTRDVAALAQIREVFLGGVALDRTAVR